jgi:hypothetical protein
LRNISRYVSEGRHVIYTDETHIYSSHTKDHLWSVYLHPSPKDESSLYVHTNIENGFIPNALLMFKSVSKSEDYRHEINFHNYERWLTTKLIPNLPISVLVVGNAGAGGSSV